MPNLGFDVALVERESHLPGSPGVWSTHVPQSWRGPRRDTGHRRAVGANPARTSR
jgi:hypothetical protein